MLTVIFVAASLTVAAIAVTVYAFVTAEDGFEDEDGFHPVLNPARDAADAAKDEGDETLPLFPEPHSR